MNSDGLTGTNGQVLTSTGTGTKWMDNKKKINLHKVL